MVKKDRTMTDYRTKAVKNTMLILFFTALGLLLSYVFRLLLARELSTRFYGFFFSALAFINLLVILRDFGLRNTLVKYISEFHARQRYRLIKGLILFVTYFQLAFSLVLGLALLVSADALASHYFGAPETAPLLKLFSVIFMLMFAENVLVYIFQGFQRIALFSISDPSRTILFIIFTFVLLRFGMGLYAPVYSLILSYSLTIVLFGSIFLKKVFPGFFLTRASINKKLASNYLRFGFFTMLSLAGAMILTNTDTLLITYFRSLEEVGVYQVAVPLSLLLMYFATAVGKVTMPMISEMSAHKKLGHVQTTATLLQKYIFVSVIPFALMMFAFPEVVIRVFFGNSYISGAVALQVLTVGTIFYSMALVNESVLLGLGKSKLDTYNIFVAALVNLILNFILVPSYGINGAAFATSASYVVLLLISTYRLNKLITITMPWLQWTKASLCGLVLTFVVWYLKAALKLPWVLELAICGMTGLAVYAVITYLLRIIDIGELRNLFAGVLKG